MRTIRWCTFVVALYASAAFAGAPHLTFTRVIAPPVNLAPAERITVIYAMGDNAAVDTFIERFVEYAGKGGALRIDNAVENNQYLKPLGDAELNRLRRQHPADAYLGVDQFTCRGTERSAEGSERDSAGARVRRLHQWIDAACEARIEVRGANGRPLLSFRARGEGTSPRAIALTDEERGMAYEQAARYTALNAAEMITPRIERESIELDDTAPQFDEGLAMINSERLADARAIWEAALRLHRDSAPLQYDLGAVCEAIGDFAAARRYLEAAVRISPLDRRYRLELELLPRRTGKR